MSAGRSAVASCGGRVRKPSQTEPKDGYSVVLRSDGFEFHLDQRRVLWRGRALGALAGCLAVVVGSFVPGLAVGLWVIGPGFPGGRPLWGTVGVVLVAAWVCGVCAAVRWARRRVHRAGAEVLEIGADGGVWLRGEALVAPGAARGARVAVAEGRDEDGEPVFAYWAAVETADGAVDLPVPFVAWVKPGKSRWAMPFGFSDRDAAVRFATDVARALGVPVNGE